MHRLSILFILAGVITSWAAPAELAPSRGVILQGGYYVQPRDAVITRGQPYTIYVAGVGDSISTPIEGDLNALPLEIAGVSVEVNGVQAPIFRIAPIRPCAAPRSLVQCEQAVSITIQVPFELPIGSRTNPQDGGVVVFENGDAVAEMHYFAAPYAVHVINSQDNLAFLFPQYKTFFNWPLVTHADGTLVSVGQPAAPGEVLSLKAVGLLIERTVPTPPTGAVTGAGVATRVGIGFRFGSNLAPSLLASLESPLPTEGLVSAELLPGSIGVFDVKFTVPTSIPDGTPSCDGRTISNMTVSIAYPTWSGIADFDGAGICVAIP